MEFKPIRIEPGVGIANVPTEDLFMGFYHGFNFAMFEMEAVPELVRRGKQRELREVYYETSRKFTKTCIRRAGLI